MQVTHKKTAELYFAASSTGTVYKCGDKKDRARFSQVVYAIKKNLGSKSIKGYSDRYVMSSDAHKALRSTVRIDMELPIVNWLALEKPVTATQAAAIAAQKAKQEAVIKFQPKPRKVNSYYEENDYEPRDAYVLMVVAALASLSIGAIILILNTI